MKDYKNDIQMITLGNISFPYMMLGTYGICQQNLENLVAEYPYRTIAIDSAYKYGNEKQLSAAIKKNGIAREQILYTGKISYAQQSSSSVREALYKTLSNLDIDYIDAYLIHSPRYTNFCDTWEQMIQLKESGMIKHIGVSNFGIEEIEQLYMATSVFPNINQIVNNQNSNHQRRIIDFCKSKGILVQMAAPFGGNTGKIALSKNDRREIIQNLYDNQIVSVIGTKSAEHMLDNLNAIR